ncbi:MAG TPA: MFS transporter [Casimicrobiaceae bacterium]|nr:MFS transporter [Casimicrobiaceae bacterium]
MANRPAQGTANGPGRAAWRSIPAGVWTLGFVSLLMDVSSELIHSLLPLFLVTTLGASAFAVGMIEGVAEATALCTKVFSGYLSDYFRRRKLLTGLGYGLAALSKPLFPLATSFSWVVAARLIDRVGKGIRGAPRDALIADITPPASRGAAYGLRQALDTLGAVAGPLLAIAAMLWFAGDFRTVFWLATVPAFASVMLLVFGVREPPTSGAKGESEPRVAFADIRRLPAAYWWIVGIAAVMTLARFSEAFLVLRAQSVGMALAWIPLVMALMSTVYAMVAYPAGVLADRGRQSALLQSGLLALIVADLLLANARSITIVFAGTAIWGVHMGLTQGVLAALVAATAPADLRGTAFGLFNLVSGIALLAASALAGWLWDAFGPAQTFYAGAVFTALSWLALVLYGRIAGLRS